MSSEFAANLARFRKARDLSQEQLAEAAAVDKGTVARIEQGRRHNARPSTVDKLAAALGVSTEALRGAAAAAARPDDQVTELRAAITATDDIPGLLDLADERDVPTVPELATTAHDTWRAYVDGHHERLMRTLPLLLGDARRAVHATDGDQQAEAQRVLSTAYRLAAGTAGRFDCTDLAWTSAHAALGHARRCDTPELETAIATRYLVWSLVRQDRFAEAERVAVTAAERIQPSMLDRDARRAGVFGNLLFNAATAATLANGHGRAGDLLAEARAAAARADGDQVTEAAIFGPRVAALQAVEHTTRAGAPDKAIRLAATIPGGDAPAFWEAGHRLVMASAELALRHRDQALAYLGEAVDLAPDWAGRQPLGQTTMQALVDHAPRRRNATFARLAVHYGVI